MTRILIFSLFAVLLMASSLGFDLSLAPGLSAKNVFLYLTFFSLAAETAIARNRSIQLVSVIAPFGAFVIYGFFSWFVVLTIVDFRGYSLLSTLMSLKTGLVDRFLIFLVFFYGVLSYKDSLRLLRMMLWVIIATNLITIIDIWNIPDLGRIQPGEDGRLGGPLGHANEYGAFFAVFLPATIAMYLEGVGIRRYIAAVGAFITFLALLMTASRGAIVGSIAGLVVGAIYLRRYISARVASRAAFAICIFVIISFAVLVALGYGELMYDRFIRAQQASDISTISSIRTNIWSTAIEKMAEYPMTFITGFGWNVYHSWGIFRYGTHNSYLTIFFNLGLIGLLFFLAILCNALATARRSMANATREAQLHLAAFIFGFLAVCATIFFGELSTPWLFIWAYAGVIMRLAVESQFHQGPMPDISPPGQDRRARGSARVPDAARRT